MLKLTIIVSAIQIFPIFFYYLKSPGGIWLLPDSVEEAKVQCDDRRTRFGPWLFYFLFFGSIAFSLGQSLYLAVYPDDLCPGVR